MSLDVYSHVMPLEEAPLHSLSALMVWSRCGLDDDLVAEKKTDDSTNPHG
jgi:hypothetical protein